jgi:hypothetical protein
MLTFDLSSSLERGKGSPIAGGRLHGMPFCPLAQRGEGAIYPMTRSLQDSM